MLRIGKGRGGDEVNQKACRQRGLTTRSLINLFTLTNCASERTSIAAPIHYACVSSICLNTQRTV